MVITDSSRLYEKACQQCSRPAQEQRGYSSTYQNYNQSYHQNADLEPYYVQIISAVFYELITKRSSSLLSFLCSLNNIKVNTVNFSVTHQRYTTNKTVWDIIPILDGINTAFIKSLDECACLFKKYRNDIFQSKVFTEGFNYVSAIQSGLKTLDENMGRILSSTKQNDEADLKKKQKGDKVTEEQPGAPDILLRIHDPKLTDKLNQLAENRRANDSALSEQIQQLQVSLQDELKQIMSIREGIDYNITQEAINQFLSLFSLVSETLQYHPNHNNKDSYNNLIESCEDFLENIKQSLSMLGVTIINDVEKPFDPELHKTARGTQLTRQAVISKVIKIGFAYKNKVLEKAEVELV